MKLSDNTIAILKNFSTINSGILIKPGKVQRTMEINKRIIAEVELEEDFETGFGFGDLNQFLGNLSTFSAPDIEFEGQQDFDKTLAKKLIIKDKVLSLEYYSASPKVIVSPPDKALVMKQVDAKFELEDQLLKRVLQIANINNLPNITIRSKKNKMELVVSDKKNSTSNAVKVDIDQMFDGPPFSVDFLTENFRMIPGSYDVEVMVGGFSKFTNKSKPLNYIIALESPKK